MVRLSNSIEPVALVAASFAVRSNAFTPYWSAKTAQRRNAPSISAARTIEKNDLRWRVALCEPIVIAATDRGASIDLRRVVAPAVAFARWIVDEESSRRQLGVALHTCRGSFAPVDKSRAHGTDRNCSFSLDDRPRRAGEIVGDLSSRVFERGEISNLAPRSICRRVVLYACARADEDSIGLGQVEL